MFPIEISFVEIVLDKISDSVFVSCCIFAKSWKSYVLPFLEVASLISGLL